MRTGSGILDDHRRFATPSEPVGHYRVIERVTDTRSACVGCVSALVATIVPLTWLGKPANRSSSGDMFQTLPTIQGKGSQNHEVPQVRARGFDATLEVNRHPPD